MRSRSVHLVPRSLAVAAVAGLAALCLPAANAAAAPTNTVVTTGVDGADADPGDGICEVNVGSGDCSLRAALMEAQSSPGTHVVTIDPSVPQVTLSLAGANEDASASGDLDISTDVTITGTWTPSGGPGSQVVVPQVSSNGLGDRALDVAPGASLTLNGVVFWGGADVGADDGGTIRNQGTVTLDQTGMPIDHRWFPVGGGTASRGGNIYNAPGATLAAHATVTGSTIELIGGTATGNGGNLFNAGTVDLDGATAGQVYVDGGNAVDGGGIYNDVGATLTLRCNAFVRFGVASGAGGTLANRGTAHLWGADLHEGHAGTEGGNLLTAAGASTSIGACDSTHNLSRVLGGQAPIGANAANHGTMQITGRTDFLDGIATIAAGAMASDGAVQLMAGTTLEVTGNTAPVAAAFWLSGGSWTTSAESQSMFRTNSTSTGSGIIRVSGGTNQITNAEVSSNTVAGDGSVEVTGGTLDLSNSSITDNTTTGNSTGPGLTVTGGAATVTNTTIAAGGASAASGLVRPLGGTTTLSYVTISAPGGLAVKAPGTGQGSYRASLVVGSCSLPGPALISLGDNAMSASDCPAIGSDVVSTDVALLDPLVNQLGITFTMIPQAANPAIDHVAGPGACPAIDQDYRTRPTDGDNDGTARCDAGAYEVSGQSGGGGGGGGGPDPRTAHVHAVVHSALTGLAPTEPLCLAAFTSNGDVLGGGEGPLGAGTIDIDVVPGTFGLVTYPCDPNGDLAPGATHRPEWFENQTLDPMALFPWPASTHLLTVADGETSSITVCLDGAAQAADDPGLCPTPPPSTPPPGVIGGHIDNGGGEIVCVAAVAPTGTDPAAWTVVGADGSFSLTVPDGDYAVVAYRCDTTTGAPRDGTGAVWSGDIAVDSSTLFRPPRGATTVRPGTSVEGNATLRLDLSAASNAQHGPGALAFTGGSIGELALIGSALIGLGVALGRPRRRRS